MNDISGKEMKISGKGKSKKEIGASLVEYVLLIALIAVIAIVALRVLGQNVSKQFSTVASAVS